MHQIVVEMDAKLSVVLEYFNKKKNVNFSFGQMVDESSLGVENTSECLDPQFQ